MINRTLAALAIGVMFAGTVYGQAFSNCAAGPAGSQCTASSAGVGTTSITEQFQVQGASAVNGVIYGKVRNTEKTGAGAWVVFGDNFDGNHNYAAEFGVRGTNRAPYGTMVANDGYMYANNNFLFMADSPTGVLKFAAGGNTERMRVEANGNIGIGLNGATAAAKLDVNGNVNVTGNVIATGNVAAKYQDVAEWVNSSEKIEVGTVVVLDPTRNNQVLPSKKRYDTSAAGVISTKPGILLGEASESKVLVAMSGRVRVKVDATRNPIKIGDLLVTSDKPGMAMKSVPINLNGIKIHRPGTLIGKALEPLDKGTGEILVLLSMQ